MIKVENNGQNLFIVDRVFYGFNFLVRFVCNFIDYFQDIQESDNFKKEIRIFGES